MTVSTYNTVITFSKTMVDPIKETCPPTTDFYSEEEIVDIGILEYRLFGKSISLKDFLQLPAYIAYQVHIRAVAYFDKLEKRILKRRDFEAKKKEAADFKDYQRRSQTGLLTPEEIETARKKKQEKLQKYLNKRKIL